MQNVELILAGVILASVLVGIVSFDLTCRIKWTDTQDYLAHAAKKIEVLNDITIACFIVIVLVGALLGGVLSAHMQVATVDCLQSYYPDATVQLVDTYCTQEDVDTTSGAKTCVGKIMADYEVTQGENVIATGITELSLSCISPKEYR